MHSRPRYLRISSEVMPELLAQRDVRRLGKHRLGLGALGLVAHVAEDDVAVGVLLDVEQRRAGERLDRVERVQERAAADEEGARRVELLVQPGEQRDAAAGRVGVERRAVLRHVGPDEAREPLADRGGLGVVADQQCRHDALFITLC